jgi:uroporphyrinogen-III synthase
LIANTGVGIRSWLSAAETWGIGDDVLSALRAARIYARGPKASGAVHAYGLDVTARAPSERLREAVSMAIDAVPRGSTVALQLDGCGMSVETSRLEGEGYDVLEIPVYDWTLPEDDGPAVRLAESVIAGRVHAVTFTAGPAIKNWLAIAHEYGIESDLRASLTGGGVVVGCVGPVCADTAAACGLDSPHVVVPQAWRLGPLVRAVAERLAARTMTLAVGRSTLVISGNHVKIDDARVPLSDTETRVLSVLAAQPNTVHAKADLLREVWRDEAADPHVVEVAVNRMRRRLGPLGPRVTNVYRRGYALRT